jgi:NADPH-dependent 2,4-dienoyl-CoA reductase/sulfur reductase-like enzyme
MIEARFLNKRSDTPKADRPAAALIVVGNSSAENVAVAPKRMRTVVLGNRSVAGANMARFLKLWAGNRLDVTLVEAGSGRKRSSAPAAVEGSNDGFAEYFPYDPHQLESRYGIHVVDAGVAGIDPYSRALTLADGTRLSYDRLEVAPGAQLDNPQRVAVAA